MILLCHSKKANKWRRLVSWSVKDLVGRINKSHWQGQQQATQTASKLLPKENNYPLHWRNKLDWVDSKMGYVCACLCVCVCCRQDHLLLFHLHSLRRLGRLLWIIRSKYGLQRMLWEHSLFSAHLLKLTSMNKYPGL